MSTAMEKNAHTNPMVTVAQAAPGGDPKGARPGAPPAQGGGLPNPVVIVRRALAHWPVAAIVMVLGVLATAQVIRSRKPIYKSETVIFYRPGVLTGDGASTNDVLRTLGTKLKEMLLAQSNLKKVLDETHLYKDVVDKRGYSDAVDQFRKNIDFKARSNDTFAISFQGSSRDEAQDITARLADMIVDENAKNRKDRAKETTEFLEAEKKHVDEDLEKLETELAQFMADHPEFVIEGGARGGAAVRAEQKKVGAAAAAERQAAQRRAVAGGGPPVTGSRGTAPVAPSPASAPPVDPVLLAARSQAMTELISAKKDLADKSVKFTNQHPDVRAAETRVAAAEAALQKAEDAIRAAAPPPPPPPPTPVADTPEDPYSDTKKPARALSSSPVGDPPKAPAKASDATLVTLETEWSRLNREVTKLRQQQQQLETKVFQAQIAASSEIGGYSATISILDPAFKPAGPSGMPNRTLILAGFAASLVFGVVLAAVRGLFLDDRLFDPSEIDALGLTPVLGIVPKPKLEKKAKTRGARA